MDSKMAHDFIDAYIDAHEEQYIEVCDKIWGFAELGLKEYKSAELMTKHLEEAGFQVERGICGMPTAFQATYGSGKPVVAILAEYDALPGISQKAGETTRMSVQDKEPGHGCGHNLSASSVLGAAIATKRYLEEHPGQGTLRVIGTPAEETIGAKTFMVRDGLFQDVDACIGYHSASFNGVQTFGCMAIKTINFTFHGISAHAGAMPHVGRSALDACELMNVGVNYLREHVKPEVRMHYCYLNAGVKAANVVPPEATLQYILRTKSNADMGELSERVLKVARGAAMMTETTLEVREVSAMSNYIVNETLGRKCVDSMKLFGGPRFDEADQQLARDFYNTFSDADKDIGMLRINFTYPQGEQYRNVPLLGDVADYQPSDGLIGGGTDLGDVSYVVPTVHVLTATYANGTPGHSWQQVAQTSTSIAHKGMLFAAKSMALTLLEFLSDPQMLEQAKDELRRRTGGKYVCPLPDGLAPSAE